jgi:PAS domain S-box-containing protein
MESEVPLNVLSVEDEPDFANLLKLNLKEALGATVTIAEDCAAARLALSSSAFDLVTIDHQLPDGDGLELLEEIGRMEDPPPVVMVTGHGDERTAVDSFNLGAAGYVVKDKRLSAMLPEALEHALSGRKLKAVEKEAVKQRELARMYLDAAGVIMLALNEKGEVTLINRKGCEILEHEEAELLGENWFDHFLPASTVDYVKGVFARIMSGDLSQDQYVEGTVVSGSGKEKLIEWHNATVRDESGRIIGTLSSGLEMTERKKAETALAERAEAHRILVGNLADLVWIIDLDLNWTYMSPSVERITGYTVEEAMGLKFEEVMTPDSTRLVFEALEGELERAEESIADPPVPVAMELELYRKDGTTFWTETVAGFMRDPEGTLYGVLGTSRDMTERKKTLDALRESEERYNLIANNSTDAIWLMDMNFKSIWNSPSVEQAGGYTLEELNELPLERNFTPESWEVAAKTMSEVLTPENLADKDMTLSSRNELEIYRKDGSKFWGEIEIALIRDEEGRPLGFLGVVRDVTERKKAEEALKESEAKYRYLTEKMNDVLWTTDLELNGTYISHSVESVLGFSPDVYIKKPVQEKVAPESLRLAVERLAEELQHDGERDSEKPLVIELDLFDSSGAVKCMETALSFVRDENGNPVGIHGLSRDITERKEAEDALKRSEAEYRAVVEDQTELVVRFQQGGIMTFLNDALCSFTGLPREELLGTSFMKFIPEEENVYMQEQLASLDEENPVAIVEHRVVLPSGEVRWMQWTNRALFDAQGNAIEFQGVGRDITERKKTEEALNESEAKFREFADNLPEVVFEADSSGRFVYVNANALEVFGYTEEESYSGSVNVIEMVAEEDRERAARSIQRILTEGPQGSGEYMARRKDGSLFPVILSTLPIIKDGIAVGMRGVLTDTTAQKKAEETLRRSEEQYRLLADNVADVIWTRDMELNLTYTSPSAERLSGYTVEEAGRLSLAESATPESFERATRLWIEEVEKENDPDADPDRTVTVQMEERCKDGSTVWVESKIGFLRDKDGKAVGMLGVTRDISERKKWEEELDRMNAELKGYAHVVSHDLKGPLTATSMVLEMIERVLGKRRLPEEKKEKLDEMLDIGQGSMRRANTLVEDLLVLAEAGAPQDTLPVSVENTVNNVLADNADRIREKGITVEFGPSLGEVVASPIQIYQLFSNLVRNSIEHSGNESPVIEISNLGVEGTVHRFLVRDNGGGIPEEILDDLFIPFVKGESGGTGIGLSIVEKIVKTYGGEIKAYNDNGACFEFALASPC